MNTYQRLQKEIDAKLFYRYYVGEGMSCDIQETMTKITKDKEKILQTHLDNVYPIKETSTGYYTKLNPKDRNHSGKISAKTKEDLETKIIAYYLEIKRIEENSTFAQIIDNIVAEYEDTKQNATGIRHKQTFYKYFGKFSKIKVHELTTEMLDIALDKLIEDSITEKDFNRAVGTLNRIQKYCKKHKYKFIDVKTVVKEWKEYHKGKHIFKQTRKLAKNLVFTEDEAKAILLHALKYPTYKSVFVGLALTTGCRMGELLCMSYDNIDLETGYFHVYETEDSHTQQINPYTKTNEDREVYLDRNARTLIKLLLKLRRVDKHETRYLFLNSDATDGKLHARAVDNYIRKLQKELEFDETKELRSCHDCRRTYATLQSLSGVGYEFIKEQLGHSSIAQTEAYIKAVVDKVKRKDALEKGAIDLSA